VEEESCRVVKTFLLVSVINICPRWTLKFAQNRKQKTEKKWKMRFEAMETSAKNSRLDTPYSSGLRTLDSPILVETKIPYPQAKSNPPWTYRPQLLLVVCICNCFLLASLFLYSLPCFMVHQVVVFPRCSTCCCSCRVAKK